MKTIPHSSIVVGMLLSAIVMAQPPEGRERGNGPEGNGDKHPMQDAWKQADKDGDKAISKEEFGLLPRISNLPEEKRNHLFERLDKNADGKISREEMNEIAKKSDALDGGRIWELDSNKDGGVSLEELKAGPIFQKLPADRQEMMFKRLDTDGDGKITPKDQPKHPKDGDGSKRPWLKEGDESHGPMQWFQQLDQNHDGSISFEEFKSGPRAKELSEEEQRKRFDFMDKNHDGQISRDDLPKRPLHDGESRDGQPKKDAPKAE